MSGRLTLLSRTWFVVMRWLCLSLAMIIISGCGDDDPEPNAPTEPDAVETGINGSYSLQVPAPDSPDGDTVETVCVEAGVSTFTAYVYDQENTVVATSDAWPCDNFRYDIRDVQPGSGLAVALLGLNDEDQIVFRGNTDAAVEVVAGEMTDTGAINTYAFIPAGFTTNAVSGTEVDLAWNDVAREGMGTVTYRIYRNGEEIATVDTTAYKDTGLTEETQYCYTVAAADTHDNVSGQSEPSCASTSATPDGQTPTVPTQVTPRVVSANQIEVTWTASTDNVGVTGYRIFRGDEEVGTSETPSFSDSDVVGDTTYCYSVTAYDAAKNESDRSEGETCATTPSGSAWYRDGDGDGYGDPDEVISASDQPEGYVADNTDCNDEAREVNPGAPEVCNEIDDNCNEADDDECLTIIDVDMDQDFEYEESDGAPMNIQRHGIGLVARVADRPAEAIMQPNYDSRYGAGNYSVKYGAFNLGNSADRLISFALIHISRETPYPENRYEVIVDTNNDENFYSEAFLNARWLGNRVTADVSMNVDILLDSGERATRPYSVNIVYSPSIFYNPINFMPRCYHFTQNFAIGEETFTAFVAETNAYDALYRANGLFVDLNGDNEIDYETEQFQDGSILTHNDVGYLIRLNYP